MILKEIAHKVAQAFRLARATDKKLSTGIAAALDAKAEQLREYEKRFEPEPPEPDPLLEARTSLAQVGFSAAAATYALRRFAEALKPEPSADASKTCSVQEKEERQWNRKAE